MNLRFYCWDRKLWNIHWWYVLMHCLQKTTKCTQCTPLTLRLFTGNEPLTRYTTLRVAHASGMPGTFFSPPTSKEIARAVMDVGIANTWWRGKLSRHSQCIRNPQFYVFGQRPIGGLESEKGILFYYWSSMPNQDYLIPIKNISIACDALLHFPYLKHTVFIVDLLCYAFCFSGCFITVVL